MYDNLFCKIFLDTNMKYEELFVLIKDYVGGEKKAVTYMDAEWFDIGVQRNKEHNVDIYSSNPNDFLYWKYYLDIEPFNNTDERIYIEKVSDLLKFLRKYCTGAIAACDFENELKG